MSFKTKLYALLVLLAVVVFGIRKYQGEVAKNAVLQLQLHGQVTLASGLQARITTNALEKDSLQSMLRAANELNGKLVAAVRLHVPTRDTTIRTPTLPTVLTKDSTRVGTFADSTFAGTLHGTVTAPPCCTPLGIQFTLTRPAFTPALGIVKVGNTYVAIVDWADQSDSVQITSPYFNTGTPALPTFGYWAEVFYRPVNSSKIELRGGPVIRLPRHWSLEAGATTDKDVFVGIHKEW